MFVLALFVTAFIWGIAFVAQSVGMDYLGPFSFNAIRYLIGSVVLIPLILVMHAIDKRKRTDTVVADDSAGSERVRTTIKAGIICGTVMFVASMLQQYGVMYTTVGKAGFVTALYIILVPFFSIFLGRKIGLRAWLSAGIALVGFYMLCMTESLSLGLGDGLTLIGAVAWAIHILIIDHYAPKSDCVMLSSIQFFVCGILCLIGSLAFETISWQAVTDCAIPILYAGIMSCGVAYTLQVVGQSRVEPTVACLILSLESVFSALGGWVILGQTMSLIEILGCVLVFVGVIIAQLPVKKTGE